jgi:alpha-galactosidase
MGWNSWNYGLDNNDFPDFNKLTSQTILEQAQALVDRGLLAAGYEYLVLDDGYQNARRTHEGRLQGHARRFRNGISDLAQEVKSLGFKFGIYSVPGTLTCAQQYQDYVADGIGSFGFEQIDADAFAEWGVEYLKYDWCRAHLNDGLEAQAAFRKMAQALKSTGKEIVFSISEYGLFQSHLWAPEFCNMWRTTDDLFARWDSILHTLDLQKNLAGYSRPGAWNDPDMLQVGNGNLTDGENRAHFFLWAVLNAPLMAGNDVLRMSEKTREILTHPGVIAINQDWGGRQGELTFSHNEAQIWSKPMSSGGSANVLLARSESPEVFNLAELFPEAIQITDVWSSDAIDVSEMVTVKGHDALLILVR